MRRYWKWYMLNTLCTGGVFIKVTMNTFYKFLLTSLKHLHRHFFICQLAHKHMRLLGICTFAQFHNTFEYVMNYELMTKDLSVCQIYKFTLTVHDQNMAYNRLTMHKVYFSNMQAAQIHITMYSNILVYLMS